LDRTADGRVGLCREWLLLLNKNVIFGIFMKDETHDLAIITIVIIIFYMKIYIPENTTYFTKYSLLLIVKFNEEKECLKLVKLDEIP